MNTTLMGLVDLLWLIDRYPCDHCQRSQGGM